jgi:hypothetical protein
MADEPRKRWSPGFLKGPEGNRWRPLEVSVVVILVAAYVFIRWGYEKVFLFVLLPIWLLAVITAVAAIVIPYVNGDNRAALRALSDRWARLLILGLVGIPVVNRAASVYSSDSDSDRPIDACFGAQPEFQPECFPSTSAPTTTPPVRDAGRPVEPECPPPDNTERQLSFTGAPPFCLDRESDYVATINTSYGAFDVELNMEGAPETVNNFAFLAGWHFYDGVALAPPEPALEAGSLLVGDPVDAEFALDAPGYRQTFDGATPPYPDGTYLVMLDGEHPNRFEVAIARSRRSEIEGTPGKFPLLGAVTNGENTIVQDNITDKGPRFHSRTIVIQSVTIEEVPAPPG